MEHMGEEFDTRHRVSVDWMLIAITAIAAILLITATIRTDTGGGRVGVAEAGGLPVLSADQRLVAFEDFSFGATGWTGEVASRPGRAAGVLGPVAEGDAQKSFVLPDGTRRVEITFDLHLSDGWTGEGLSIRLDDVTMVDGYRAVAVNGGSLRRIEEAGRTRWSVSLRAAAADEVTLRIGSDGRPGTHWAIDNVLVVATGAAPTS